VFPYHLVLTASGGNVPMGAGWADWSVTADGDRPRCYIPSIRLI